eukprot:2035718-Alexandrium_andersonii.AAC.1
MEVNASMGPGRQASPPPASAIPVTGEGGITPPGGRQAPLQLPASAIPVTGSGSGARPVAATSPSPRPTRSEA